MGDPCKADIGTKFAPFSIVHTVQFAKNEEPISRELKVWWTDNAMHGARIQVKEKEEDIR